MANLDFIKYFRKPKNEKPNNMPYSLKIEKLIRTSNNSLKSSKDGRPLNSDLTVLKDDPSSYNDGNK